VRLASGDEGGGGASRRTPVTGSRVIGGLTPCNVIPEEILTDHPKRFRAMLVESANPAHSLADGPRMREALAALDLVVVIDVAFTETARLAHYVLPVASQFEKAEATFFNFDFPENYFHLRKPLLEPLPGLFSEAELHARSDRGVRRDAAGGGRRAARRVASWSLGVPRQVLRAGLDRSAPRRDRPGAPLWCDRRSAAARSRRSRRRVGALPDGRDPERGLARSRRLRR
jgi:hypothetical protein